MCCYRSGAPCHTYILVLRYSCSLVMVRVKGDVSISVSRFSVDCCSQDPARDKLEWSRSEEDGSQLLEEEDL